MEQHPQIPGRSLMDGVSLQQTMQMFEYKYSEHLKKLNEKWLAMKKQLEKETKSISKTSIRS